MLMANKKPFMVATDRIFWNNLENWVQYES